MAPDPANPTDRRPTEVAGQLEREGLQGQFQAVEGGLLRCLTCGHESPAAMHGGDGADRVEGASDPDDMLLIVAVRCPACGAAGWLSLGYGPAASVEDADVIRNLAPYRGGSSGAS
jgi:hypothetical protein